MRVTWQIRIYHYGNVEETRRYKSRKACMDDWYQLQSTDNIAPIVVIDDHELLYWQAERLFSRPDLSVPKVLNGESPEMSYRPIMSERERKAAKTEQRRRAYQKNRDYYRQKNHEHYVKQKEERLKNVKN